MTWLVDTPGLYFVLAMLMPLATFLVVLVGSLIAALARRHNYEQVHALVASREVALLTGIGATAVMALAFVLSVVGFVQYESEFRANRQAIVEAHAALAESAPQREKLEALIEQLTDARTQAQEENNPAKVAELTERLKEPRLQLEEILAHEQRIGHLESFWQSARASRWTGTLLSVVQIHPTQRDNPTLGTTLRWGYTVDSLTGLMFVMITFIGMLIHLYSITYMRDELPPSPSDGDSFEYPASSSVTSPSGRFSRFFLYLSLFSFAMLHLVLADNFFQVFVCWELVGLCSYLLIGFYTERPEAGLAANKAFLVNRLGDIGLILGMAILWTYCGTLDFERLYAQIRHPLADAHQTPGKLAGAIVRAEQKSTAKGQQIVVSKPGEGGNLVVLFPERPLGETLTEPQAAELKRFRQALHRATDPAERARLERLIAAKDPSIDHFHNLGPNRVIRPRGDRVAEEFGVMPYGLLVLAGLGIFAGCVGKSAQFPLHVWLPDAMAGPTPVSALIHAATMVAAGVYLAARCYFLFTPEVLLVIAYLGAITLLLGASLAIVANDIKQVLAYSTVSQLGLMMLAIGVGGWTAGLFHLLTHAFFKALLFLGAGAILLATHHQGNLQQMGGLRHRMPYTALCMLVGVLAITGVPFTSGWYSKDAILSQALGYVYVHREHAFLFVAPALGVCLTAFALFRLWFLAFVGQPRNNDLYQEAQESPWPVLLPLGVLAVMSVGVAWSQTPWDVHQSFLRDTLAQAQPLAVAADFGTGHAVLFPEVAAKPAERSETAWGEQWSDAAGLLAFLALLVGFLLALASYGTRALDPQQAPASFPAVHQLLVQRFYLDALYDRLLVKPTLSLGRALAWNDRVLLERGSDQLAWGGVHLAWGVRRFDLHLVDGLVNGLGSLLFRIGQTLRTLQTGYVRTYILYLVFGVAFLFALLLLLITQVKAR